MATDSKDDDHQPEGTPNAGGSAPKAGAGDGDDLHEDSFHGMHRPRCMPGDWLGGGFALPTKDGFDGDGGHALPFFLESSAITTHRGRARGFIDTWTCHPTVICA